MSYNRESTTGVHNLGRFGEDPSDTADLIKWARLAVKPTVAARRFQRSCT